MALLNALQLYVIIVVINICGLDKTSNRKKKKRKNPARNENQILQTQKNVKDAKVRMT